MSGNWGILIALAPFIVVAILILAGWKRYGDERQEFVRFGRQNADATQDVVQALKENNALLRSMNERLERLEARDRK